MTFRPRNSGLAAGSARANIAIALGLLGIAASCGRSSSVAPDSAESLPPITEPAPVRPKQPGHLQARCHAEDLPATVSDGAASERLEVGNAVVVPEGYAFSLASDGPLGRRAAIAIEGSPAHPPGVDLGRICADCPPPIIAPRRDGFLVASSEISQINPKGARTAQLKLVAVGPGLTKSAIASIPVPGDSPPSFDVDVLDSDAMLVWDEAASAGHGRIWGAFVEASGQVTSNDISPIESDADAPRVVVGSGPQFEVVWIAHGAQVDGLPDVAQPEVPGTTQGFGWLQSMSVDRRGALTGDVHDLTSRTGHVSAFDVGRVGSGLLVVARDDSLAPDGTEGELVSVRIVGGTPEPPQVIPCAGLGRGSPSLIVGSLPWISWTDADEQLNLLLLDKNGAPLGSRSQEGEMKDAHPLLSLVSSPGNDVRLLVAEPSGDSSPVRIYSCADSADL